MAENRYVSVRVPEWLMRRLKAGAQAAGQPVSAEVRRLLVQEYGKELEGKRELNGRE